MFLRIRMEPELLDRRPGTIAICWLDHFISSVKTEDDLVLLIQDGHATTSKNIIQIDKEHTMSKR